MFKVLKGYMQGNPQRWKEKHRQKHKIISGGSGSEVSATYIANAIFDNNLSYLSLFIAKAHLSSINELQFGSSQGIVAVNFQGTPYPSLPFSSKPICLKCQ